MLDSSRWSTFSVRAELAPSVTWGWSQRIPGSKSVGLPTSFVLSGSSKHRWIELQEDLREVIEMLLEDSEPKLESEFVDVHTIQVA